MPQRLAAATPLRRANLQQAAVHRVGDGLLLHRGVHDDAFELALLDGADIDGGVDGGAEQFFQAGFAQNAAKASDLGGIARWARVKVFQACKVLPADVLSKALHQFFVTETRNCS